MEVASHSRHERHLMRQRGAGTRAIKTGFGLTFPISLALPKVIHPRTPKVSRDTRQIAPSTRKRKTTTTTSARAEGTSAREIQQLQQIQQSRKKQSPRAVVNEERQKEDEEIVQPKCSSRKSTKTKIPQTPAISRGSPVVQHDVSALRDHVLLLEDAEEEPQGSESPEHVEETVKTTAKPTKKDAPKRKTRAKRKAICMPKPKSKKAIDAKTSRRRDEEMEDNVRIVETMSQKVVASPSTSKKRKRAEEEDVEPDKRRRDENNPTRASEKTVSDARTELDELSVSKTGKKARPVVVKRVDALQIEPQLKRRRRSGSISEAADHDEADAPAHCHESVKAGRSNQKKSTTSTSPGGVRQVLMEKTANARVSSSGSATAAKLLDTTSKSQAEPVAEMATAKGRKRRTSEQGWFKLKKRQK